MKSEYVVRTCLICNHSFKSRVDAVNLRCSKCGSVKIVNALEMPPQLSQDIEINKLKELATKLENRVGSMAAQFIEHGAAQKTKEGHVSEWLANIDARLKSLGV